MNMTAVNAEDRLGLKRREQTTRKADSSFWRTAKLFQLAWSPLNLNQWVRVQVRMRIYPNRRRGSTTWGDSDRGSRGQTFDGGTAFNH